MKLCYLEKLKLIKIFDVFSFRKLRILRND